MTHLGQNVILLYGDFCIRFSFYRSISTFCFMHHFIYFLFFFPTNANVFDWVTDIKSSSYHGMHFCSIHVSVQSDMRTVWNFEKSVHDSQHLCYTLPLRTHHSCSFLSPRLPQVRIITTFMNLSLVVNFLSIILYSLQEPDTNRPTAW